MKSLLVVSTCAMMATVSSNSESCKPGIKINHYSDSKCKVKSKDKASIVYNNVEKFTKCQPAPNTKP